MATHHTIQAELYHLLKGLGVTSTLEVRMPSPIGRATMIADLVVWEGDRMVCLVEVKKNALRAGRRPRETRQRLRYEATGLPFIYCRGEGDIERTVAWCLDRLGAPHTPLQRGGTWGVRSAVAAAGTGERRSDVAERNTPCQVPPPVKGTNL